MKHQCLNISLICKELNTTKDKVERAILNIENSINAPIYQIWGHAKNKNVLTLRNLPAIKEHLRINNYYIGK